MSSTGAGSQAYRIGDAYCSTTQELAEALVVHWELGIEHVQKGYAGKWLEDVVRDYDAKIALDKYLEEYPAEIAAMFFALDYAPGKAARLRGVVLDEQSIRDFLKRECDGESGAPSDEAVALTYSLYRYDLLTDGRLFPDNDYLGHVNRAWHREFENYCRTRGDMLLYADVWKDPTGVLARDMYQERAYDLAFATAYEQGEGGQIPSQIDRSMGEAAKAELLAELLQGNDLTEDFRSSNKVEALDCYDAANLRKWFADMVGKQPRSAGREAFLRHAARLASEQVPLASLAEMKAGVEEDGNQLKSPLGEWISTLDRRWQAALFSLPMFLAMVYYGESIDSVWMPFLVTGTMAIATFGWTPFRIFRVGALPKLGYVFVAILMWLFFLAFYWDTAGAHPVLSAIPIAALSAVAGWFRQPLLAARAKKAGDALIVEHRRKHPNTASRIDTRRLELILFPEKLADIPRSEWQYEDFQRAAAMRAGNFDPAYPTIAASDRSRVAANHGDGTSITAGGINAASDGTTTLEVLDGISIDNRGGINARVMDGVTVHSDGKYTTEIMKGVSIRSDGQVKTEFMGMTFASGGKDKKKKPYWQED